MTLNRRARRAICGAAIVAACVGSVLAVRQSRAFSLTDPGIQARTKGAASASVLLVEYSDFQCPSCMYARPILENLLKQYGDRIRFVFRHYPLAMHPFAYHAAVAAECAAYQGKFWPYHDLLFDKQQEWSKAENIRTSFGGYAKAVGLDGAQFEACLDGKEAPAAVQRDIAEADAWQVNSTPTLFIGRERLIGAQQIHLYGARLIEQQLRNK